MIKKPSDRPFGVVAALAVISGAAVIVPSMAALGLAVVAVVRAVF